MFSPKMSRNQSNEILIFGLNAAFQSTLYIKEFRPGHVNRASRKCNSIGGKGQNFAIACAQYGELDKVTVVQAVGGMTGKYCEAYLDEVGIHHITSNYVCNAVKVGKTTRTCTTILDLLSGDMTEVTRIEGIALCGTSPSNETISTTFKMLIG